MLNGLLLVYSSSLIAQGVCVKCSVLEEILIRTKLMECNAEVGSTERLLHHRGIDDW